MPIQPPLLDDVLSQGVGESIVYGVDLRGWLGTAETLAEGVTVSQTTGPGTPSDATPLTLSQATVTADPLPTDSRQGDVPTGQAVRFRAAGGQAGAEYRVTLSVGTSDGNTLTPTVRIRVA